MLIFSVILIIFIIIFFSGCYYCYWYAFKRDPKRQSAECDVPPSEHRKKVIENIMFLMQTPFEDVEITSKDSLKLYGRYYHIKDDAPVAILFHGYRSNSFRDGSGCFKLAREYGLNILMPDQRSHGKSEGSSITFGIKEKYDCAQWVNYAVKRFGKDVKIVLIGLSMGAATVMMASDIVSKENVKGVIADCGFSSPKEILIEVAGQMKYPRKIAYFLVKTGAKLFGGFHTEESSALTALQKTDIPVLFIHGEGDNFVPCRMSVDCHKACASEKKLFTVPGASHGMSYYVDTPGYTATVTDFLNKIL